MPHARPDPLARSVLLGVGLALATACTRPSNDDDDDDDGWDTSSTRTEDTGSPDGGGSDGGDAGDGVSPVITEGHASYDDHGALGIVGVLWVRVEDPNDDVDGGTLHLRLSGGDTHDFTIGGEDASHNAGIVSLIFANVDPEPHTVELQVSDAAGHASNVWSGVMEG